MNNPNSKLCPKCGKPYIQVIKFNFNYRFYIHKRKKESVDLFGLIDYCIVSPDYDYKLPGPDTTASPLNPKYRTSLPEQWG